MLSAESPGSAGTRPHAQRRRKQRKTKQPPKQNKNLTKNAAVLRQELEEQAPICGMEDDNG